MTTPTWRGKLGRGARRDRAVERDGTGSTHSQRRRMPWCELRRCCAASPACGTRPRRRDGARAGSPRSRRRRATSSASPPDRGRRDVEADREIQVDRRHAHVRRHLLHRAALAARDQRRLVDEVCRLVSPGCGRALTIVGLVHRRRCDLDQRRRRARPGRSSGVRNARSKHARQGTARRCAQSPG